MSTLTIMQRCAHNNCCSDPDLAHSDYYLFQYLKRFLTKQHFPSDDDVQTEGCFRPPAANLFEIGVHKLVSRYDTGFNSDGSYVER
ncbi:hypothetical protein AVEN_71014-1 [Araneus ventricosus]|uniref:Uncharacterized protein n=1 Tax=Araneus ventricosus TaxID=182803 RepID=A0A4Y2PYE9_ARAVE|nr:hypothetical protein AVEN_71014-1 [Araneus ventricosus]